MPIFHFHHWCDGARIPDCEGGEYRDLETARREAIAGARGILGEEIRLGLLNLDQRFEVHDGDGNHLFTTLFTDAVDIRGLSDPS